MNRKCDELYRATDLFQHNDCMAAREQLQPDHQGKERDECPVIFLNI